MLKKLSPEGKYKSAEERIDMEEFKNRVENLRTCIGQYATFNHSQQLLKKDIERIDINETCGPHMKNLKDFINKTGTDYENVYAPITYDIVNHVQANRLNK
jgi:hypothetical protein